MAAIAIGVCIQPNTDPCHHSIKVCDSDIVERPNSPNILSKPESGSRYVDGIRIYLFQEYGGNIPAIDQCDTKGTLHTLIEDEHNNFTESWARTPHAPECADGVLQPPEQHHAPSFYQPSHVLPA